MSDAIVSGRLTAKRRAIAKRIRPVTRTIGLPTSLRDGLRVVQRELDSLAVARTYAPFVLATGALVDRNSERTAVIHELGIAATDLSDAVRKQNVLLERLREAVTANPIALSIVDDVDDLYGEFAFKYGDAGYLLGLAVGQQLGPAAFAETR